MIKITCPSCRKSYTINILEDKMVNCWTCGCGYYQDECTEHSTCLDPIKIRECNDKKH